MDTIHARYHALPFGGEARVFLAGDTLWRVLPSKDPRLDWGKFVGGKMETYETPGDHTAVIHEPNVKVLAKYLGEFLQQVS
jgi:thioesterase domain-containing protein